MWCSLLAERAAKSNVPKILFSKTSSSAGKDSDQGAGKKQLKRRDTLTLVRDVIELRNRSSFAWLQLITGFDECGRKYCLPINNVTSEESQLIRGEMANYELRQPDLDSAEGWRPIRCTSYLSMRTFVEAALVLVWLFVFGILVKFSPLRQLMRSFPTLPSLGNVSTRGGQELDRESLSHIKFCQTFLVYGTPGNDSGDPLEQRDKHSKRKYQQLLVSRVVGPEPNHVATASFAIQAALALTLERDHLPPGGGVLTPGVAFSETNIIYQLRRRNLRFEVLKKA